VMPLSHFLIEFIASTHDPNRCFQWTQNKSGTWHTYSGWTCF
jgi:hypothetical protein